MCLVVFVLRVNFEPILSGVGAGPTPLSGTNQNKIGFTMGTVGKPGFNLSALTDSNAATQQAVLQQQLFYANYYSPYGDNPLFLNPIHEPKKKEEVWKALL